MATPRLDPEKHFLIHQLSKQGKSHSQIADELDIGKRTVGKYLQIASTLPRSNKKSGDFKWREWVPAIKQMQTLKKQSSWSQDTATIELGDGTKPIGLIDFSDQHMGAWSTDYDALCRLTDDILNTEDLYVALLGDYGQYAIKLRNVLEVSDNMLPPEQQTDFIESWFDEIWHKVALATWDNHGIERQEKQAGESSNKRILNRRFVYFNGIGHADIKVGSQIYRGAFSHRFRGRSIDNPVHGAMRYMRREGIDRDFAFAGDTHLPGIAKYTDGPKIRAVVNSGSIQSNSGYAKRYFSLTTHPVYPVLMLHPDRHEMIPLWSVKEFVSLRSKCHACSSHKPASAIR